MNQDESKADGEHLEQLIRIHEWGKLTDDELDVVEGRRELLVGKMQSMLGISREEANRRYEELERVNFALI